MQYKLAIEKAMTRSIVMAVIVAFCLEPKLLVKIPLLNWLFICGAVISFLAVGYLFFKTGAKRSAMLVSILLFRATTLVQTVVFHGDVLTWGYMTVVLLTLCLLFDYCANDYLPELIRAISSVLLIMTGINLLVTIAFPNGVINGLYFIGIRTRVTDVVFPLVAFCIASDWLASEKIGARSVAAIMLSLLSIGLVWIGTAIVGAVIALVAFFVLRHFTCTRIGLSPAFAVTCSIVLTVLVVGVHVQDLFSWFITGVLGKDPSLTYRTNIWDVAVRSICERPFFGYGLVDNGLFVKWGLNAGNTVMRQSHNQWLQLLHDGGIVHALSFAALFFVSSSGCRQRLSLVPVSVIVAVIIAFCVMMTTEIYSYTPYLFLLLYLAYHSSIFHHGSCCHSEECTDA